MSANPGKPSKAELSFLMGWHGMLSGAFLIAYITGEASYAMHVFSGVMVLLALGIRLLVGIAAPKWLSAGPTDTQPAACRSGPA